MRYSLLLCVLGAFLILMSTPVSACSCSREKGDLLNIPGLISFDGRVIDVSSFNPNTNDVVVARIQVVRNITGALGSEIKIITHASSVMCGAGDQLVKERALGRIREFHIWPTQSDIYPSLPAGDLYLGMCGVHASELDPDLPRARR